jgi:hypothetical protein
VIETWFRDVKVHFGMEAFHSRSDQLIEQEIHALMAWLTVCAIVERNVYARIERSRGPQRLDDPRWFQISPTNPYNAAARIFTRLLVTQDIATALAESEVDLRWLDSTAPGAAQDGRIPVSGKDLTGGSMANRGPLPGRPS